MSKFAVLPEELKFYKDSLYQAEIDIKEITSSGTALKDTIGAAFEAHRKRIWEYFGFTVTKKKYFASFNVDWSILYDAKVVAMEEDKGHYCDSCFLERALLGFIKTINNYKKENKDCPILILHSFTKYRLYEEKKNETLEIVKKDLIEELNNKVKYTTLTSCDRIHKKKWFIVGERYNSYTENAEEELIKKDIIFMKSLIPGK
tara:strand:+ start:208 stop:816 length:609 start_codon:yes stop_codon:yes gene_type:complete